MAAPISNAISMTFTPGAFKHVQKVLSHHQEYQGLRLSVKKSGCSGLAYLFDYVKQVDPEDTCFVISDSQPQSVSVFIEPRWQHLFQGVTIDYVKTGLNARLECINPNEVARCGCGESFSVEPAE